MVLKSILVCFWARRNEVTREWRRLCNEVYDQYFSPSNILVIKSRRMRLAGHVACMGERRSAYRVLVGRPEGRRPLGRPWHRWEGNIKMDLQDLGWGSMDWIDRVQNRDREFLDWLKTSKLLRKDCAPWRMLVGK
jgi:hypothetical protein